MAIGVTSLGNATFNTTPLHRQVYEALRAQILGGVWRPGHVVKNEVDLAREYGVSVGTLRRALEALVSENLLLRKQGRGTFVRDPSERALSVERLRFEGESHLAVVQLLGHRQRPATDLEVSNLKVATGDNVSVFDHVYSEMTRPLMHEQVIVPAWLVDGPADAGPWSLEIAISRVGKKLDRIEERVYCRLPGEAAKDALGIDQKLSVMVIERTSFASEERALEKRTITAAPGAYYESILLRP